MIQAHVKGNFARKILISHLQSTYPTKVVYQLITPSDTDTFSFIIQPIQHEYDTQFVDLSNFGKPETCDTIAYERLSTSAYDVKKDISFPIKMDGLFLEFGKFSVHARNYPNALSGEVDEPYSLLETLEFNGMTFTKVMTRKKCENVPLSEREYYNSDVGIISTCLNAGDGFELFKLIEFKN